MYERLSVTIGNEELILETGKIAKQAHGSVMVTMGETMVLSAVCVADFAKPGQDFFPLTVEYREKSSAAGKIPGNYFRRESRPSEREILVCRQTDRPMRPLFPKGFYNEVQVFSTVYSADNENNPDVMSMIGASAAVHISKTPFEGPIGAVRIGRIEGQWVVNPRISTMPDSDCDIVIAGTRESITMVEGMAKELGEDDMLEALELGHKWIKVICDAIDQLRAKVGQEKIAFDKPSLNTEIEAFVNSLATDPLRSAFGIAEKKKRRDTVAEIHAMVADKVAEKFLPDQAADVEDGVEAGAEAALVLAKINKDVMRKQVIEQGRRIDGRDLTTIRPITIEVGVLPRAHGSCLFTRGETQALVTTTLGTSRDEQRTDELTGDTFKRFMLHYNFPSWSVGEVRRISGPGRREVGHGRLAERALENVVPHIEITGVEPDFPYTVRVLSDITESNGSSSMASVCGGSLSLMDAGVPILAPVAGIAMGLIKEGEKVAVLSDILGDEDHLGDMDFKVCGTRNGITAFQMDCKVMGVSREVMKKALDQARDGRIHILNKMEECLGASRDHLSKYAPQIFTIKIDVDKIREVIGPGGKVIRDIQAKSGAEIEIEDDGTVNVAAVDKESAQKAIDMIQALTASPEVGTLYDGVITRIMSFGAVVAIMQGHKEGLIHVSELAPGRVEEVTDAVNIGDAVKVKLVEVDKMGRLNFSKVQADIQLGLIDGAGYVPRDRSRDRDRGGDRGRSGGGDRGRSGGGRDHRGGGGGRR
jgi:polyribonucleotide nucleotidyltransferase